MKKETEFYIGWMATTPGQLGKKLRRMVMVLVSVAIGFAIVISGNQKKFSTASFEFGQLTAITGIYQEYPVPSLYVNGGRDNAGQMTGQTIILVGYGKMGAEGVMQKLQQSNKLSFVNRRITLKGTLLFSDGKTLLQVDANDAPLVSIEKGEPQPMNHRIKELGNITVSGEILDPKCYFGVMKPGQGKPHRDCAVRCIEGGMAPVFYVQDASGSTDYYLLLGPNGERINHKVKDFIAEPVSLHARAVRFDDWIILYVDMNTGIERIAGARLSNPTATSILCAVPGH